MLPRYGPNHMMSVIFVWQNRVLHVHHSSYKFRNFREMGDKVLVLKKSGRNSSYGDGFITGFVSDPEEQPFADVPLELIKKSLKQEFSDTERVNKILKNAKKRFVKLVGGSVPSTLETDHAWVELQMFLVPCRKTKKLCRYGLLEIQEEYGLQWYNMKTENAHALNQSITSLINSKPENQERYSIFCEGHRKNKSMLSIIFASIMLIGGASGAVALTVAFATSGAILVGVGVFFTFCLLSNGLFAIGAALYNKYAE
ncbi:hypothetical protein D918_10138 [Trichuris suis]|nr:hypothetical protein D918_10139 [Trichuris suis]KHJ39829.1 hypothetical protein D918_10138 [Trichuris suis]